MGSNSTQRAINNYITAPGSKGTTKGFVNQQMAKKQHLRAKKLVNIKDQMVLPANQFSQNILHVEQN